MIMNIIRLPYPGKPVFYRAIHDILFNTASSPAGLFILNIPFFPSPVNIDIDFDFDFKILTALKGWVGHAPQGRGALLIHNYRHCALLIII